MASIGGKGAVASAMSGTGLGARILRSSLLTVGGFGFGQAMRLASNLILTRLLFPEAFGMMALVSVLLQGLQQFSDVGVTPSILHSKRGDDPAFLNTAWTIQILRGLLLWLAASALAWPFAAFYGAPELRTILPVAALSLVISGFNPTRLDTANRHLMLGRVTLIDMGVQTAGVAVAVALAYATGSVWALVWSGIASALLNLVLLNRFLPGPGNRLGWEREAAAELIGFGKWIFLSTICGFLFHQADKLILGRALNLALFGIYNIGFFLASFPMMLGSMLTHKLLIPIYRECPPAESAENFARLRRMRFAVTGALLALGALAALLGPWLVDWLYDPRYAAAGGIVTLLACMQIPRMIVLTYDQAALAAGDSRRFFIFTALRAALVLGGIGAGVSLAGLMGAVLGLGAGLVLSYPVAVWLARRSGAWDPLHDMFFTALGGAVTVLALGVHWDAILGLARF